MLKNTKELIVDVEDTNIKRFDVVIAISVMIVAAVVTVAVAVVVPIAALLTAGKDKDRDNDSKCFRCGSSEHWADKCKTEKHLVALYKAST